MSSHAVVKFVSRFQNAAAMLALVASGSATSALASGIADHRNQSSVIYGNDDRRDLFDAANDAQWVELSRSTAALLYSEQVKPDPADPTVSILPGDKFGDSLQLCAEEPFRDQPAPAFCSGFLLGDDILVTAGHCVETQQECDKIAFVFGFDLDRSDRDATKVATNDVYTCKRLVSQSLNSPTQTDYAIVQLNRKVEGRAPLKFRREGKIADDAGVTVIGHPAGLPTKIASDGAVRKNGDLAFFVANLDTYGGNSGSAVFNTETHEVEGILVRGENDFITKTGDTCQISNHCAADGCRGEDSTRTTEFAALIADPNQPTAPTVDHDYVAAMPESLPIPDNDPQGITVEIPATDAGTLQAVAVHVKLHHTYIGDLVITLVHPDGTEITLSDRQGGNNPSLDLTYGDGGRLILALMQLKGKEASGTWKVIVKDLGAQDTGALDAVTLTTKLAIPTP